MDNPINKWQGQFGDDYTKRNDYDPTLHRNTLRKLIPDGVDRILEVGCNRGKNLQDFVGITMVGIEPNISAATLAAATHTVVLGQAQALPFPDNSFDLVFTCGVLMHIPDYEKAMKEIWRVTRKYALAIEYKGNGEEVPYRGNEGMLWKRKEYWYPGKLVALGQLGLEFDHSYYWLYSK